MDNLQAKQMLKQVDCHGIPKGYNGGYSELYEYCLKSIEKLEQIEQIIGEWNDDWQASQKDLWMYLANIKEVLEQE
jgi:hypothetical protein